MTWAWPERLPLALLLVPVAVLLYFALQRRARDLHQLAAAGVFAGLVPRGVGLIRVAQAVGVALAVGLIAVALAGPRLGFDWQQRKMQGVSIVAVLDVSRSMDAQDEQPSRLDRARRELEDLAGLLRGDAIGLVIFAAGGYARIPLTVDYDTFVWAVRDSSADTLQAQGTSLAGALEIAVRMLGAAEGTGKAVVVVSDGEGHDADAVMEKAVQAAVDAGVHIYALGVGSPEGAPIPLATGGFKKDNAGNVVLSRLEEAPLQALAEATGGAYVRAVPSDDDVRAVYEGEIRAKLEASERGMQRDKVWREQFQVPLGAALLLLVLQAAASVRWRRPVLPAALLGLVLLGGAEPAFAGPRDDGLAAWKAQKWEEAIPALGQAVLDQPADREAAHALGESLYRAGRFREAEQVFRRLAAGSESPVDRAIESFNAGNAAYRGGRLEDALKDYQAAASEDASFEAAKKNAEAVAKEIEARKSPPPPRKEGSKDPQKDPGKQGESPPNDGGQQGEPPPGGGESPSSSPPTGSAGEPQEPQAADPQPSSADPAAPPGAGEPAKPENGAPDAAAGAEGESASESAIEADDPSGERGMVRLTPEQASRLVDSVQEGKPRVRVSGQESEKDW